MQESCPIGIYGFTDENYAEFARVRGQITHARFEGGLTNTLDEMFLLCVQAYQSGEDFAPIISEYYGRMKQMMAE